MCLEHCQLWWGTVVVWVCRDLVSSARPSASLSTSRIQPSRSWRPISDSSSTTTSSTVSVDTVSTLHCHILRITCSSHQPRQERERSVIIKNSGVSLVNVIVETGEASPPQCCNVPAACRDAACFPIDVPSNDRFYAQFGTWSMSSGFSKFPSSKPNSLPDNFYCWTLHI